MEGFGGHALKYIGIALLLNNIFRKGALLA